MKTVKFYYLCMLLMLVVVLTGCNRKSDYNIDEIAEIITDEGSGTGTTTWTSDKSYLLDGFVFVNDDQELTIEAGTVIRAKTGQVENASALIVARGGKIKIMGTLVNPVIFTCEGDDLEGSVPLFSKGLWGGLIILGNAPLNNEFSEAHVEGIPISEPRGVYGGGDEEDDSGILRYVSIRHGGTNIGSENEINGLTLGGVGNKTIIEYIEVISNKDDGIEFFGGTVNCKNIVSAFNGDDAFDFDLGYQGYGQFWLGIEDVAEGDLLVEGGGGEDPELGMPYSLPVIYNCTFIGRGSNITNRTIQLNRYAGLLLANSLLLNQNNGVFIEYKEGQNDCYQQFENGNIQLLNNIFWDVAFNISTDIFKVYAQPGTNVNEQNAVFSAYFSSAQNTISNPGIEINNDSYNVLPSGNISDNLATYPDAWFNEANFKGAFLYDNWARNWTLIHQSGWLK